MNSFDFSEYDYSDNTPIKTPSKDTSRVSKSNASFEFDDYETPLSEDQRIRQELESDKTIQPYLVKEKSPEEIKKLSPSERYEYAQDLKRLGEYQSSAGFMKSAISGLTFGASEDTELLKPKSYENNQILGYLAGETLPFMLQYKVLSLPLKAFDKAAKWAPRLYKSAVAATTAGGMEAEKQGVQKAIKGKEFEPTIIALHAAGGLALDTLIRGGIKANQWYKSLNAEQQANMLKTGLIPDDLSTSSYKYYEKEIVPEMQRIAQEEYQNAYQKNVQETQLQFQQRIANTKAEHENDLKRIAEKNQANQEKYSNDFNRITEENQLAQQEAKQAQEQYQARLKHEAAEHQNKMREIEEENALAMKEYEQSLQDFETLKARQQIVEDSIGPDIEVAPTEQPNTLKNRVGKIFSDKPIENTSAGGEELTKAIRANDNVDYNEVRKAYDLNDKLNANVENYHPILINELQTARDELILIPQLSPPEQQKLQAIEKILQALGKYDAEGNIIGLNKVSNKILQEQAKSLRYFQDFNFEHGNARGILTPTIRQLENAAESAAIFTRNEPAIEASRKARGLYKDWTETYNNDYIRPFRDTSNFDYSKLYKGALDIDEYRMIDRVLSKSHAGTQLSNQVQRSLVEKQLGKFFKDPSKVDIHEFNEVLNELSPIVPKDKQQLIRNQFKEAQTIAEKQAEALELKEQLEKTKEPVKPELKEITQVKLPIKQPPKLTEKPLPQKPKVEEITQVKLPKISELKPSKEMQAASKKMGITPEQAMSMTETPTGLKHLKSELSKSPKGKELFERIGHHKLRDQMHHDKIIQNFKGNEFFDMWNKSNEFNILSEIIGEEAALDTLQACKKIADNKITKETLHKYIKKGATIKTLAIYGLL